MFANDMVEVRVEGNNVLFRSGITPSWTTIEGLQLSYEGVCREFPDLEGQLNWKEQAIERFKDKVAGFKTDDKRMEYIMEDLKKYGYIPKYYQKGGHRRKRLP